jgi:hypothetical protein
MTPITTDRDRLMLAFAELNRLGIAAWAALPGTAPEGHALLRTKLARRFPSGMRSYVFWSAADEHRFSAAGELTSALSVHCSAYDVAVAVAAACRDAGIEARPDGRATVLRLAPRRKPAAAPAPAAQRRAERSPWRWLEPRPVGYAR